VRYVVCELQQAVKAIKFSTVLKWVGYATAILSFVFGVRELIKIVSDRLESRHEVGAMLSSAEVELRGKDYSSAWRTLEQASKLQPNSAKVRLAQENLAMKWLEDTHLRENERFSDIGDKLEPVLTRGLSSTKDAQRTADLLAHIGWAYFLRSRDGAFGLDPVGSYSKAQSVDPHNPFAQAMWGHWILWNHGKLTDASQHFSSALASGRERDFVRRWQLAALFNCPVDICAEEILRVANDVRNEHGTIGEDTRDRIFSLYYDRTFSANPASNRFLSAIPPAEHVATFRWLFDGLSFGDSKSDLRTGYLAVLQEVAGQRDDALANYRALRSRLPKHGGPLSDAVDLGIQRLSTAH
jgi:hypothetical protein